MRAFGMGARPEQSAKTPAKPQIACKGAAKSAATSVNSGPPEPDLAYLVDSWPCLPPSIKAAIVDNFLEEVLGEIFGRFWGTQRPWR